jgi:hypothetical protein
MLVIRMVVRWNRVVVVAWTRTLLTVVLRLSHRVFLLGFIAMQRVNRR